MDPYNSPGVTNNYFNIYKSVTGIVGSGVTPNDVAGGLTVYASTSDQINSSYNTIIIRGLFDYTAGRMAITSMNAPAGRTLPKNTIKFILGGFVKPTKEACEDFIFNTYTQVGPV